MEYKLQMEAQRRAFEAQFGSLEEMGFEDKTKMQEESDDSSFSVSGTDSEVDDSSEEPVSEIDAESTEEELVETAAEQPKVVKFKDTTREYTGVSKHEEKLLKSGKANVKKTVTEVPKTKEDSEDLKNDLELQRFLSESNILQEHQKYSGADLLSTLDTENVSGTARRHTLRSRMDTISAINGDGKHKLEKMPMSHRKGMVQSHKRKVAQYEQDAKDGGIVLSKVKKGEFRDIGRVSLSDRIGKGKASSTYRQKGLKIHSVGKNTRNGLVISQLDIDRINGAGKGRKGKKGTNRR